MPPVLIIGPLGLLAAFGVGLALWKSPSVGAVAVLSCLILGQILPGGGVKIGINVYPEDFVTVLLAVLALCRFTLGLRRHGVLPSLSLLLFALILLSFLRGAVNHGVLLAGVEVRPQFYAAACLSYFAMFDYTSKDQRKLTTIWMAIGLLLVAVAAARWAMFGAGAGSEATELESVYGSGIGGRALTASACMFIASCCLLSLSAYVRHQGPKWQRLAFLVFGGTVVILQHRTLWVALGIAILWSVFSDRSYRTRAIGVIAGIAVTAAVLLLCIVKSDLDHTTSSLSESAENQGTFEWRYLSWVELLQSPENTPLTYAVGQPFGHGFTRYILNHFVDVQPHNHYVFLLLRIGLIGVGVFLALYATVMRSLRKRAGVKVIIGDRVFWQSALLMQLVYGLTYSINYDQMMMLGVLIGSVHTYKRVCRFEGTTRKPYSQSPEVSPVCA